MPSAGPASEAPPFVSFISPLHLLQSHLRECFPFLGLFSHIWDSSTWASFRTRGTTRPQACCSLIVQASSIGFVVQLHQVSAALS